MLTEKDFLRASGTKVTKRDGSEILLHGVNLGGWLIQESWMCPVTGADKVWGNWDTLQVLTERFGKDGCKHLMDVYQDHWIGEYDLDVIASLNMNIIRVPFWYRNLQADEEETWYKDNDGNIDFSRLDWIVSQCAKRDMYVILDLHGAPGFQSQDHCCGRVGHSVLFDDTEEGELKRQKTIRLWTEVAKHFQGNPAVAAYDLLNEPMNGDYERKDDTKLWALYDRLYHAIRAVDKDHMLSMEGVWEWDNLCDPAQYGWTNVWYQLHNYNWKTEEIDAKIADTIAHEKWNVPLLVGEFQAHGIWDYVLSAYEKKRIHWTTWTYKGAKCNENNDWFLHFGNPEIADCEHDSFEVIKKNWSQIETKESFKENKELMKKLRSYAKRS